MTEKPQTHTLGVTFPKKVLGFWANLALLAVGLCSCAFPTKMVNPVAGANTRSWNHKTFWYAPWGTSITHKGIDIFAPTGTPIIAPQSGFIYFRGEGTKGGNRIYMMGPLLRVHYFAHLSSFELESGRYVGKGDTIGYVGTTGNAIGKVPHLHYHIITLIPYPWKATSELQGWKKMFYLDPGQQLLDAAGETPSP